MQPNQLRTQRILIVEREGVIAADVQQRLQRLGYPIPAIARPGEEALRRAHATPIDFVLVDMRLQGDMDGLSTAHALRTEHETPVVYLTANSDQEATGRARLTQPLGYLGKPVSDDDLRRMVQVSLHRHQMEKLLHASQAWLSNTLRCVGDGIIATDTAGNLIFMNPVAEKLTGWSSADAQGRQITTVLGLFDETTGQPTLNPVLHLSREDGRSYNLISKDGSTTVVEVECFAVVPGAGACGEDPLGAMVVLRDISARRQSEANLVLSQRMEAVASMAGGLAHDFNNQLTVILGYAQQLCEQCEGEARESAIELQHAASTAASITAQLMTLSRREPVRLETLNVNEVVCEMQPPISHSLGHGRTLVIDLSPRGGFVRGDKNQLKQVLLNLALNARDAMPGSGELRIRTTLLEIAPQSREALPYRTGQYVRLSVADNGCGMEKAIMDRIFEPFFTTHEAGFGTGLGLSMVRSIIARSGGHISVESEVGKGTTFEILLPCSGAAMPIDHDRDTGQEIGAERTAVLSGQDAMAIVR